MHKKYKIEIDEEIFNYLNERCTFADNSPNKVLRKLLLNKVSKLEYPNVTSSNPYFISKTNKSLDHVLWMLDLVWNKGYTRVEAKNEIAKQEGITPETVHDKYTRRIGLTTWEIDKILNLRSVNRLKNILTTRYPLFVKIINARFQEITDK